MIFETRNTRFLADAQKNRRGLTMNGKREGKKRERDIEGGESVNVIADRNQ